MTEAMVDDGRVPDGVDPELVAAVSQYVGDLDEVQVLSKFLNLVSGMVDQRRELLEEGAYEEMEAIARRYGHSLASWVAQRTGGPGGERPRVEREFSSGFNYDCVTGAWSLKVGQEPGWVRERLEEGYSREQLTRQKGAFPTTKGQIYLCDPETGDYALRTRTKLPRRYERLLERGFTWKQISRPPSTWSEAKGRVPPNELPPELEGPTPANPTMSAAPGDPAAGQGAPPSDPEAGKGGGEGSE